MDEKEGLLKRHTDQLYRLEKNERIQDVRLASVEKDTALQERDIKGLKEDLTTIKEDTTWIKRAMMNGGISLFIVIIGGVIVYAITNF